MKADLILWMAFAYKGIKLMIDTLQMYLHSK